MGMHVTIIGYPTGGIEKGVKFGKKGIGGKLAVGLEGAGGELSPLAPRKML
jgi:hypothetical protein